MKKMRPIRGMGKVRGKPDPVKHAKALERRANPKVGSRLYNKRNGITVAPSPRHRTRTVNPIGSWPVRVQRRHPRTTGGL